LPSQQDVVILAMDVSGSMRAHDVAPSRLAAAQAAARSFIAQQPRTTRLGVVSFAGTAALVQAPTDKRQDIVAAIDRFQVQHGTAIGSAILTSLKSLFPEAEFDLASGQPGRAAAPAVKPVPPGSYTSAAIILITDGQSNAGPDPMAAARLAASRGVRVFTIGIGTAQGTVLEADGWSMRVRLDEAALKSIARTTHGEYFHAAKGPDLEQIYRVLNARFEMEKQKMEVGALFAAAATAFLLAGGLLSLWRTNRII